jgi:hypothetical protein
MSGPEHEAHWKRAPDFAEIAEALHVPTTAIMAAMNPESGTVTVLYTPDVVNEPERIYSVTLSRDAYGVLGLASVPVERVGMWEEIMRRMDEELPGRIEERLREEDD